MNWCYCIAVIFDISSKSSTFSVLEMQVLQVSPEWPLQCNFKSNIHKLLAIFLLIYLFVLLTLSVSWFELDLNLISTNFNFISILFAWRIRKTRINENHTTTNELFCILYTKISVTISAFVRGIYLVQLNESCCCFRRVF